ncbi:hypothetical protein [Herminiimonas fonticola]|uniref:Lipoprotein n=1 Tax=Herminiimonas fonticola TaxID=303380 RepID=A0A4R6G7E0_9BURK|nr:hypothetical protein [Herminiimonas fonticola]RBA23653.1 hypothetical protein Hfont_1465 [Herminiimonas fonticola]TDN89655.1 hypothetical protein EV677_1715 [Herminiimonas fonticola]
MTKISFSVLLAAIFIIIAGCGKEPEAAHRFSTVDFEGYKLPGRIEQAKAMGFQSCESSYDNFKCRRAGAELLGVKALNASLLLEYKDYFLDDSSYKTALAPDQRAPEKLTYGSISFVFPETNYDARCIEKKRTASWDKPIECRKGDTGTDFLKHKLSTTGWFESNWKMHRYYFKEDQLVGIHIDRDGKTVTIKQISQKERDSEIQSIKQKNSDVQARQAAQDDVLKKLKD